MEMVFNILDDINETDIINKVLWVNHGVPSCPLEHICWITLISLWVYTCIKRMLKVFIVDFIRVLHDDGVWA